MVGARSGRLPVALLFTGFFIMSPHHRPAHSVAPSSVLPICVARAEPDTGCKLFALYTGWSYMVTTLTACNISCAFPSVAHLSWHGGSSIRAFASCIVIHWGFYHVTTPPACTLSRTFLCASHMRGTGGARHRLQAVCIVHRSVLYGDNPHGMQHPWWSLIWAASWLHFPAQCQSYMVMTHPCMHTQSRLSPCCLYVQHGGSLIWAASRLHFPALCRSYMVMTHPSMHTLLRLSPCCPYVRHGGSPIWAARQLHSV